MRNATIEQKLKILVSTEPTPAQGAGQLCLSRVARVTPQQAPPPEDRLEEQEDDNIKVPIKWLHLAWIVVNSLGSVHSLNHPSTE